MQLGVHKSSGFKPVSWLLICVFILNSTPTFAISDSKLFGLPAFQRVVAVITAINIEMEETSKNPMNDDQRRRVQAAWALLPPAIMGLAAVFKEGKELHDGDLAFVQGYLGGFVNPNAPAKFEKFLKHPDRSLIPKTGPGFPTNVPPANIDAGISPNDPGYKALMAKQKELKKQSPIVDVDSNQVATLDPTKTGSGVDGYSYDENAKVSFKSKLKPNYSKDNYTPDGGGSSDSTVAVPSNGNSKSRAVSSQNPEAILLEGMRQELSDIERGNDLTQRNIQTVAPAFRENGEVLDSDFFQKLQPSTGTDDQQDESSDLSANQKAKTKKYWQPKKLGPQSYFHLNPLMYLADLFMGGGGGGARAADSGCGQCQGGQGGGQDGGGGGGSKAAEILQALAMMIAAAAPIAVAAFQASADKQISKDQKEAAEFVASTNANVSLQLAQNQKEIAAAQTQATLTMAANKENGASQRLQMQLAQVQSQQDAATQSEQRKQQIEMYYNNEKLAFAQKQANDNLLQAKESLNASLSQAGLISGVKGGNSANSLTTTRPGLVGAQARANTQPAQPSNPISINSLIKKPGADPNAAGGGGETGTGFLNPKSFARGIAAKKLMNSLNGGSVGAQVAAASNTKKVKQTGRGFGVATMQVNNDLVMTTHGYVAANRTSRYLLGSLGAGSSPRQRNKIVESGSDIAQMAREIAAQSRTRPSTDYFSLPRAHAQSAQPQPAVPSTSLGGYNVPTNVLPGGSTAHSAMGNLTGGSASGFGTGF